MSIEQLKSMSNAEINKLCATNIMKYGYRGYCEKIPELPYVSLDPNGELFLFDSEGYKRWNPSEDMNDLKTVEDEIYEKGLMHEYTLYLVKISLAFGHITYQTISDILRLSTKERCIAALMVFE